MHSATIFFFSILVGLLVTFQETEGGSVISRIGGSTESNQVQTKIPELSKEPPEGWKRYLWYLRKTLTSFCTLNYYLSYLPF
uniref:Uncharacterized protein n=1 Tax=Trichobilharzia regenti TaxID=157069 RepID=A0AA85IUY5_TRIRE|nr:unnamed protein product [Trichobilharzia regenti]